MKTLSGALDAEAVIGLAMGGVFDLLEPLYAVLYVPPKVVEEVTVRGQGRPGDLELRQALGTWVTVVVPDSRRVQLFSTAVSAADREVLAIAHERQSTIDHILSSDDRVTREAARHGLTCLRTTLAVVLLKSHALVPAVRPVLDRMRQGGFGIDNPSYEAALRVAGE